MKRLRITVEGVAYDVEVELLEDDEVTGYGAVPGTGSGPMLQSPVPVSSPRPTPVPASSPPAASTPSTDNAAPPTGGGRRERADFADCRHSRRDQSQARRYRQSQ